MTTIQRPRRGRFGKKAKNEFDLENQKYSNVDFSKVDGFAEIFPEDKHLIVQLLQNEGFIVGMTGDGANVLCSFSCIFLSDVPFMGDSSCSDLSLLSGCPGVETSRSRHCSEQCHGCRQVCGLRCPHRRWVRLDSNLISSSIMIILFIIDLLINLNPHIV